MTEYNVIVWYTFFLGALNLTHAHPHCVLYGKYFLGCGSTLTQEQSSSPEWKSPLNWKKIMVFCSTPENTVILVDVRDHQNTSFFSMFRNFTSFY